MTRATVALIIPALNEAEVIGATLDALLSLSLDGGERDWFPRVIVGDNGSTDGTAAIALGRGVSVATAAETGYGSACLAAMRTLPADTDIVAFMQADLSEDARELERLVRPILEGRADMVIGSRTQGHAEPGALTMPQRVGNLVATNLIWLRFGHYYSDLGPFRAIRWDALKLLQMQDRTYGWTVEMQIKALHHGLRVIEVPVSYKVRAAGVAKVTGTLKSSIRAGWKILTTIAKYWRAPAAMREGSL